MPRAAKPGWANLSIAVDRDLFNRALAVAGAEDRSMASLVRRALRLYVEVIEEWKEPPNDQTSLRQLDLPSSPPGRATGHVASTRSWGERTNGGRPMER
jgi:hypothetical protein